jgi:hypothetical protein
MRELKSSSKVEEEFRNADKIKKIVEEWSEQRSKHHIKKLITIKSRVELGKIKGRSYNAAKGIVTYTFWDVKVEQ